jgi:integrase
MGVIKRPDSDYWYIEFIYNGRRHKASSGTTDKTKARAIEAKMRTELLAGNDPSSLPKITLAQAIARYIDAVIKPKNNAKVLSADSYLLGRVRRDLGADLLLTDITAARIATYRDRLLGEDLEPATVNRYLSAILALLNRSANEWGWLRAVPTIKLLRLNNARYRWLNAEEEASLLAHCPSHLADLVVFLIETGARLGEALRLTWADVDLDRQPRGLVKFMKTKSGKPRGVPLTTRARDLLARIKDGQGALKIHDPDQGRVFLYAGKGRAGKGVPLTAYRSYRNPHGSWATAVERAELGDLHLHDLRHTFASRLVMRGVPILAVSKLLGHATLTMTMRYAHLAPDGLDAAIEYLDR